MNTQQIPAILLILGFVLILVATIIQPPGLYKEKESNRQLELISNHSARWIFSNLFYALAALVTAGGLTLFSLQFRGSENMWLAGAGSAAYILGAIVYAIFLCRRTIDPASIFMDYRFSPLTAILLGSLVIGLLLYGMLFLQVGYPRWLGLSLIAGMLLTGGAALFFPEPFFKSFPVQALYLFTLVTGIVMLMQ
ncbi:MAG TPA: hypothetical protein VFR47_05540 [Anaerolineales bacterium]|nr:hypothetical protein [Anaerolineales bacterium]